MIVNSKYTKKEQTVIPNISYFTLFKFATKWDKLLISVALIAIFIAGLTMPYSIVLVANAFQSMIDYARSNKDDSNTKVFLKSMHQFGINYSCVGVLLLTGGYLGSALMNVAAINQIFKIRLSYFRAVLNQDLAYYDLHQTGDFASKMAEDMIKLEEGIGNKVSALLYNTAVSISCIVMALIRGWKLALLCLSTAPITFLLVGLTGVISNRLYKKQAQAKGEANAIAEEALGSIKTVYAFNGQEKEIERYKRPLADARRIHIQKEFFTGLSMGFLFFCVFSSYALAFYMGIYLIINEPQRYNADVMFSVFFGVLTALSYFGMIGNLMTSLGSARGAGASIFYVLHSRPIINPSLDHGIKPDSMEGNIYFKNVYFEYPSRPGITVLNGVNINISSGQSVALVGQSGCGKSTVVALISRYYDVIDGSTYSFGKAGAYLTERLRLQMFTHFLCQDVAYFDDRANSTGALCARLSAEAAYVQGATGQRIGVLLQAVGSVGLALLLAVWFQWRVVLVALAFLPVIILVTWQQGVATDKESSEYSKSLENSTKIAVEAVSNIRTVASLGREYYVAQQYAKQLSPAMKPARRAAHWRGVLNGLSKSVFNFVNAAALTYGGHLIATDGIAYQNILIATQALQMASSQAQNAFAYAPDFQKGTKAATRILDLLKTKPKVTNPDPSVENFKATGAVSLIGVSFKYPSRPNTIVLRDLHLEINRGKTIAIVGQSGCGKSTIIQLLQRYYDPDAGNIFLDDIPLNKLRLSDARASFGLVSQEPVLFDRSIRENIAYGDNSRVVSEVEIIAAAKQANIHDFIVSLPQGYETEIGARGVQLSGGQKQRVAIARALIRQPVILLLDEATSALDNESEQIVQAALEGARADRTCILIAHRLSTVRDAHEICVLRAGRIAEQGTHSQLAQLRGLYFNLLKKGLE